MIIRVPVANGGIVLIKNLSVDTAKETLNIFTCPSGCAAKALKEMQDKAPDWVD